MRLDAHRAVPPRPFAVGATLPDIVRRIGVMFWHIPVYAGVVMVVVVATRNFVWALVVVAALIMLERHILKRNVNRPRELWAALRSGSLLADRRARRGAESPDIAAPRGGRVGPL